MCVDNSCLEISKAIYHADGAALAGTTIASSVVDPTGIGNKYRSVTVVNDTDQDIKFSYVTNEGKNGEFIVPKSIKGFTKVLRPGKTFQNEYFKVTSMHGASAAVGNITINLGS